MDACADRLLRAILGAVRMKIFRPRLALAFTVLWLGLAAAPAATPYRAGDIVTNDLAMQTRLRWTNTETAAVSHPGPPMDSMRLALIA